MSPLSRAAARALKRSFTRLIDRIGRRLVSGMADTSSDAPSASYAPKRDLYQKLKEEEAAKKAAKNAG